MHLEAATSDHVDIQSLLREKTLGEDQAIELLEYAIQILPDVSAELEQDDAFSLKGKTKDDTWPDSKLLQFRMVVGKLGNTKTDLTLGTVSEEWVALLTTGLLYQDNSDRIIQKLEIDTPFKNILSAQLEATGKSKSTAVAFMRDITSKTQRKSLDKLDTQTVLTTVSTFISEQVSSLTLDVLSSVSTTVLTEKFVQAKPRVAQLFIEKSADEIEKLLQVDYEITPKSVADGKDSQATVITESVVRMKPATSIGDLKVIDSFLGTLNSHQLRVVTEKLDLDFSNKFTEQWHAAIRNSLTKISNSILPNIKNIPAAFVYPDINIRILNWEHSLIPYVDPKQATMAVAAIKMALERVLNVQIHWISESQSTGLRLLDAWLGFYLDNIVPPNESVHVNTEFASSPATYASKVEVNRMDMLTSAKNRDLIIFALDHLARLHTLRTEELAQDEGLSGIRSCEKLITESPDIFNIIAAPQIQRFILAYYNPAEVLKKIQLTTTTWSELIDIGLADQAIEAHRRGAHLLLYRINAVMDPVDIFLKERSPVQLRRHIEALTQNINEKLSIQWEETSDLVSEDIAEILAIWPVANFVETQLYAVRKEAKDGERSKFNQQIFDVLRTAGSEDAFKIGIWMLNVLRENTDKPRIYQLIFGILNSPFTHKEKVSMLDYLSITGTSAKVLGPKIAELFHFFADHKNGIETLLEDGIVPSTWIKSVSPQPETH